ncbi:hypothetical protein [Nocardia sp. NPDC050710]|uniref:HoxN/HupN/NixA family nickel/cobalt transporter n=1 Tax=Nocardia sp. NPDC050710 TaxID=3157220 RepID=UPI0033F6E130
MDRRQRRDVAGMALVIVALHILGWATLLLLVVPGGYVVDGAVFGVGLGVTAYTLGMRHAFDADHIAAIDNTTRKLVADGRKPLSVGFWFALGHSTIVFVLVALLAFGVKALAANLRDENSGLQRWTGVFGTGVSGTFLLLIGLLNLVSLTGLSVAVALLIGAQEIISILTDKLGITSGPVAWVGDLDLGALGFLVVGLFVLTWAIAVGIWRLGGLEQRWCVDRAGEGPG